MIKIKKNLSLFEKDYRDWHNLLKVFIKIMDWFVRLIIGVFH